VADQCETPDYTEGPCHCDYCDPGRLREDRIETIYQGWGAREMAERIVELEDEAATLNAEADRARNAWRSARRRAKHLRGAWNAAQHAIRAWRRMCRGQTETMSELIAVLAERTEERDRYRLAWLSARRRAADEANFGMEALDRERARQASFVAELRPIVSQRMTELRRLRAFADDVIAVRGWCMDGEGDARRFLTAIYDSTYELESSKREERSFRARLERRAIRGDFDDVYEANDADEQRKSTDAPSLEFAGQDEDGEVWKLA
jgi:hypothetical protein